MRKAKFGTTAITVAPKVVGNQCISKLNAVLELLVSQEVAIDSRGDSSDPISRVSTATDGAFDKAGAIVISRRLRSDCS